jgi:pyruvate ferredoxin oxidoreductase gamma subunit/2-oxoisovalerate ferredoxin oxidoreductase gamma subunit
MLEIRFHGRGGQGTVVASIVLAKAFFETGYNVQSFPLFGVERRGAPVEAYLRLDKEKIFVRSNVYSPDYVVVQDPKLLNQVDVIKGLKPGGWILINNPDLPENLKIFAGYRLAVLDAVRIALNNGLGTRTHPIVNTAMIGAFARVIEMPPIKELTTIIEKEIPMKSHQNAKAANQAYEKVNIYGMV